MKKILLYGDSNTYGYDPRGMLGMRYPKENIWPSILRRCLEDEYEIIEEGQNGRTLPRFERGSAYLLHMIHALEAGDYFVIMLGTNDILLTSHPQVEEAKKRMDALLTWVQSELKEVHTIVIGPVWITNANPELAIYHAASKEMNCEFQSICKKRGVTFWNAGKWNIPLAYDGVHFSEEGHEIFAKKFLKELEKMKTN
ncbi:GDSL-type esterase/lipase family protein [Eubacterium oxidoreducens]|uniref:Lysophospholipase L1 n=1 Tax=Eubacterium oxidoreducens TaxID=1732 RepID=A0A1G6BDJ9_EUBOX|nr:GDSL-type esterase/lipase family protein [Eubacterium oxidoreducens]SDB18619.1 Lysophospholipase L1 [Eubacterium oxidoreducens]